MEGAQQIPSKETLGVVTFTPQKIQTGKPHSTLFYRHKTGVMAHKRTMNKAAATSSPFFRCSSTHTQPTITPVKLLKRVLKKHEYNTTLVDQLNKRQCSSIQLSQRKRRMGNWLNFIGTINLRSQTPKSTRPFLKRIMTRR